MALPSGPPWPQGNIFLFPARTSFCIGELRSSSSCGCPTQAMCARPHGLLGCPVKQVLKPRLSFWPELLPLNSHTHLGETPLMWKVGGQDPSQEDVCFCIIQKASTWQFCRQSGKEDVVVCTMGYYSAIKRVKSCHLQQHG